MDKEKEVKPNLIQYRHAIYRRVKITDQVSGHIEVNVDEALSAEREKRELESKRLCTVIAEYQNINDTLEEKVKELQSWKDQVNLLDSRFDDLVESPLKHKLIQKYMEVDSLESQLATANAKIVELETKCKNLDGIIGSLDVKDPNACDALLNVQLINQNTIKELKAELSTANKKAENRFIELVEHIKRWNSIYHLGIKCQDHIEDCEYCQALIEYRGEK